MATLRKHLDDLKWKFFERGMQVEWTFFSAIADATTQGVFVAGAGMIGAVDVDAAASPGLTAAVRDLTNPSGQLNLLTSTTLEYSAGAVSKTPPTNIATS